MSLLDQNDEGEQLSHQFVCEKRRVSPRTDRHPIDVLWNQLHSDTHCYQFTLDHYSHHNTHNASERSCDTVVIVVMSFSVTVVCGKGIQRWVQSRVVQLQWCVVRDYSGECSHEWFSYSGVSVWS